MAKTTFSKEEVEDIIGKYPTASFTNNHGEKFNIHSDGIRVFMSGDEVRAMVREEAKIGEKYISLFSDAFNVWSNEELRKLGQVLQQLHPENKDSRN